FRKVLQTLWHQVQNGQEIFVVGKIQPDDTVVGGTGIAAEFGKLFNKPLFVFDQVQNGWFSWTGEGFEPAREPTIRQPLFCGTGTRFLQDNGHAAIDALFARTFSWGTPPGSRGDGWRRRSARGRIEPRRGALVAHDAIVLNQSGGGGHDGGAAMGGPRGGAADPPPPSDLPRDMPHEV